jgi:hypothetical protein
MTVVRLSNGDLFFHSPIKFDVRLANELLGLGTVRHLVSPNQFHYAHIGEWAKAFPNAVSWASPRVRERARARHVDVDFTRDLETSPPEEWCREIDQTLFPGSQSTVCGLAWKRYSRQTPLRDVVPTLNGRASLAGVRPCRTGAASFMVARARDRARRRA